MDYIGGVDEYSAKAAEYAAKIGAVLGGLFGTVAGFYEAGIGGAIVYTVTCAIGGALLGAILVGAVWVALRFLPLVLILLIVAGIVFGISSLWNVGKPGGSNPPVKSKPGISRSPRK